MIEQAYEREAYKIYTEFSPTYREMQSTLGHVVRDYTRKLDQQRIEVLELGCGYGDTSLQILNADPRINLTMVDIDPEMIIATRERLCSAEISSKRYHLFEGKLITIENEWNGIFDICASAQTMHGISNNGPDSKKAHRARIAEMLVPGGLYVNADRYVFDFNIHIKGLGNRLAYFSQEVWARVSAQTLDSETARNIMFSWSKHFMLDTQPEKLMYWHKAVQDLIELGFENIQMQRVGPLETVLNALKGGK